MAEAHKVDLVISAVDKASGPLKRISGGFNLLSKQGLMAGAMFAGVTIGLQAVMQGFQQLKQYIGTSVKAFRDFELRMAEVNTMLTEQEGHLLPGLQKGIEDLAVTYGKSADDMARGMYQVLSASVDAGDALYVLEVATKAATAGLTTTEVAVDAITTVMNAYGMSVSEVNHISDIMFETVVRGKLRFDDLASSLGYIVPIAAQAGIEFEEVAAAIATLTRQGINAQKATTGLRQLIANIIAPSVDAADAALRYGIVLNGLMLDIYGIEGVMRQLSDAAAGNLSIFTDFIPNIRALQAALGLTGEAADGFSADLIGMEDALGATNTALKKIMDTGTFMQQQLESLSDELDRQHGEVLNEWEMGWKKSEVAIKGSVIAVLEHTASLEDHEKALKIGTYLLLPWTGLLMLSGEAAKNAAENEKRLADIKKKAVADWQREYEIAAGMYTVWELNSEGAVKYMKAQEVVNQAIEDGIPVLDEYILLLQENEDAYHAIDAEMKRTAGAWADSLTNFNAAEAEFKSIGNEIENLEEHIVNVLTPIAHMNMDMKRAQFFLHGTALEGQFFSSAFSDVVSRLKESKTEMKSMTDAQRMMNLESKKLSIEVLRLQMSASGRRGRLNRNQRRQMEVLEKAQMQNRLKTMEGEVTLEEFKMNVYEKDQKNYQNYVNDYKANIVNLSGLRDEELENARSNLADLYTNQEAYRLAMGVAWSQLELDYAAHMTNMANIGLAKGTWSPEQAAAAPPIAAGSPTGKSWGDVFRKLGLPGFQTGTPYVPHTGLAMLHRGEAVIPANKNRGGDANVRVAPITVNVNNNMTPEQLAQALQRGLSGGILKGFTTVYG